MIWILFWLISWGLKWRYLHIAPYQPICVGPKFKDNPNGLKSDRHVLSSKDCCSSHFFSEQSPHFELHSISRNLCYHMLPTDLDIMPLKPSQNPYTSHSISRKSISNSKKNQQNPIQNPYNVGPPR